MVELLSSGPVRSGVAPSIVDNYVPDSLLPGLFLVVVTFFFGNPVFILPKFTSAFTILDLLFASFSSIALRFVY